MMNGYSNQLQHSNHHLTSSPERSADVGWLNRQQKSLCFWVRLSCEPWAFGCAWLDAGDFSVPWASLFQATSAWERSREAQPWLVPWRRPWTSLSCLSLRIPWSSVSPLSKATQTKRRCPQIHRNQMPEETDHPLVRPQHGALTALTSENSWVIRSQFRKTGLEVDPALTHKDSEPAHSLKNALVISNCMQLQQSFEKQILKLLDTSHFLFDPLWYIGKWGRHTDIPPC